MSPFHVLHPVQGLEQGTNISIYSFVDGCYARLCTPLSVCAVARHEAKSYATEVCVWHDLVNRIQVTAADIVPGQLFFRKVLKLTSL
jgi:hypothetical protein